VVGLPSRNKDCDEIDVLSVVCITFWRTSMKTASVFGKQVEVVSLPERFTTVAETLIRESNYTSPQGAIFGGWIEIQRGLPKATNPLEAAVLNSMRSQAHADYKDLTDFLRSTYPNKCCIGSIGDKQYLVAYAPAKSDPRILNVTFADSSSVEVTEQESQHVDF